MSARDKVEQILREMIADHLEEFDALEAEIPAAEQESRALLHHFCDHLRAWTPPASTDLE